MLDAGKDGFNNGEGGRSMFSKKIGVSAVDMRGFNTSYAPQQDDSEKVFSWINEMEAKGKQNVEKGVGRAAIDTTSSYDKARQANERAMAAKGINPGSGIFAGKTDEWALARAAAEAGARNRARTEGENQNNNLMERLLSLKMSQYNKNRDFNYQNNSSSNSPTITTGGRNPAKDKKAERSAIDFFTKAYNHAKSGGVSTGNVVAQAANTNSPTNGQSTKPINYGKNVNLGGYEPTELSGSPYINPSLSSLPFSNMV